MYSSPISYWEHGVKCGILSYPGCWQEPLIFMLIGLGCRTGMRSICNSVLWVGLQSHCFCAALPKHSNLPGTPLLPPSFSFLFPFCYRCILTFWDKVSLYSAWLSWKWMCRPGDPSSQRSASWVLKVVPHHAQLCRPPQPLPTTDLYRSFQIKNVNVKQIEPHTVYSLSSLSHLAWVPETCWSCCMCQVGFLPTPLRGFEPTHARQAASQPESVLTAK